MNFKKYLEESGFLPLENDNWNKIEIIHKKEEPPLLERENIRTKLKQILDNKSGLYGYINKEKELLYIGKATNIYKRVWSHYRETYKESSGDRKKIWHEFFHSHAGELELIWLKLNGSDRIRHIIEQMIEHEIPSIFEKEYPRGNRALHNINL